MKRNSWNRRRRKTQEYNSLIQQADELNKEIEKIDEAIKESEDKYNQQMELFKVRLKVMYQNSNVTYIESLSESESIVDFWNRLEIVSAISKKTRSLLRTLRPQRQMSSLKNSLQ